MFRSPFDEEVSERLTASLEVLESLGARVVEVELPDLDAIDRIANVVMAAELAAVHGNQLRAEAGRLVTSGGRVLVILDSDHRKPHVLKELNAYSALVQVGGYIIVQDGVINGHPISPRSGPGPYEAVEAFIKTRDDFIVDESRERLILTYNPKGFLKRVR